MSDGDVDAAADNVKNYLSTDEGQDTEESLPRALNTTKKRKSLTELRHPRQKFCIRWETDFPWLRADKVDESIGICVVCKKHLVCKKSHLERHQKSYKHQRLQGFESLDTTAATEFLECGKREANDEEEFGEANDVDPEYNIEFELKSTKRNSVAEGKRKSSTKKQNALKTTSKLRTSATKPKLDHFKLLKCINRDRQELNEYFELYGRKQLAQPEPQVAVPTPATPRDSFDLFFDSVSASVKTLPPKLAAETKGRISQIIAEFELRAITEREAAIEAIKPESTYVVASTTTEATQSVIQEPNEISIDTTTVPHIVYTFQPK